VLVEADEFAVELQASRQRLKVVHEPGAPSRAG
jgi:hypothetical protein